MLIIHLQIKEAEKENIKFKNIHKFYKNFILTILH